MEALLKKQTDLLSRLESDSKQDKIIQLAQLYEERRIDDDGDRMEEQLVELNKNLKKLNEKTGDNLNSNVIKLFKEVQKTTSSVKSRPLNQDEVGRITATAGERRQFNTLRPRVDNFKAGVKDFFTMRGFLDKTGIVPRGSGGIISEYLDRKEEKEKYVQQRIKTKSEGTRESFEKEFEDQQRVRGEISKNEREISDLKAAGATDAGLKNSGLLDKREQLAAELAKVDPSVRPEGFDPKTGMIKDKPQTATEQAIGAFGAASESTNSGAITGAAEESMLEQNRMVAEQTGLLIKIEENTRALKGGLSGSGTNQQPVAAAEEGGGLGLMDMLGSRAGKFGRIAKSAGRGLMTGARTAGNFLMKRAGPLAAVAAVGAGLYEGYQGWTAASDKQDAAKEDIKAKLEAGEITQGEAAQLTKQVDEQATVEKGAAAGKGGGMALGGAAGAAIGSVVPVVGTVIGGAIGATVGAIGGSWLGGKAGEWIGEKAGKAKNWAGGLLDSAKNIFSTGISGKEAAQNMEIEVQRRMEEEGVQPFTPRANEIRQEVRAEILAKDPNAFVQADQMVTSDTKLTETSSAAGETSSMTKGITSNKSVLGSTTLGALFSKKGLETGSFMGTSAKEGNGTGAYSDILGKRVSGGLFGSDTFKISTGDGEELDVSKGQYQKIESLVAAGKMDEAQKLVDAIKETKRVQAAEKAGTKPMITPPEAPQTGNMVAKQSGDNEQAKIDAGKSGGTTAVVAAPTINNNNTVQNTPVKLPPRNTDSTVNKYLQSRWAY